MGEIGRRGTGESCARRCFCESNERSNVLTDCRLLTGLYVCCVAASVCLLFFLYHFPSVSFPVKRSGYLWMEECRVSK